MTNDEAIKTINKHHFLFASMPDDLLEALDLAIMALEQVDIVNTMKGQRCMPKGAFMALYNSHDDEDDI